MGRFLVGAFVELCQLVLVLAAALFAIEIAIGRDLHGVVASDVPLHPNPAALVLLVVYGLLVWWPARDLVEGWLGMVSRRLPDRYTSRGENLGRGVMGVVFAVFWAVLWFVADPDANTRQGEAFDLTYALLALAIFGLGGAVPRLWFASRPDAWTPQSALPELLRQAGRRGALFIVAIFVGIALGFVAGYSVQVGRADYVAPAPERMLPVEDQRWGALCRVPTADCPGSRHVVADVVQKSTPPAVRVEVIPNGNDAALCQVTAVWAQVALDGERILATSSGAPLAFDLALPDDMDRCSYFIDVKPAKLTDTIGRAPPSAEKMDLDSGTLCRTAGRGCPATQRISAANVESHDPTRVRVTLFPEQGTPMCDVAPEWPVTEASQQWFAHRVDDFRSREMDVVAGAELVLTAQVPDGVERCQFFIHIELLEGDR